MRILIVEDEWAAVKQLKALLTKHLPESQVVSEQDSISETVAWLEQHPSPDLAFFDIEIADGQSLSIFRQTEVRCPVIFVTAYDQYMLEAFETNGIAYLLKPVEEARFVAALRKYTQLQSPQKTILEQFAVPDNRQQPGRFLARVADRLVPVMVQDLAWATVSGRQVQAVCWDGRKLPLDFSLDELENKLPGDTFFRLNRKVIAHLEAIQHIYLHLGGKLKISLQPEAEDEIYVSREKAGKFKQWLGG